MFEFYCPRCRSLQQVEEAMVGRKLSCRQCGQRLQVPAPRSARGGAAGEPGAAPRGHWHHESRGRTLGPVCEEDLEALVVEGGLGPADRVWCEGMASWQPAGRVLPWIFARHGRGPVGPDGRRTLVGVAAGALLSGMVLGALAVLLLRRLGL